MLGNILSIRWGLVPFFAKEIGKSRPLITARGETVAEKSSFKMAFERGRCLVPATGCYKLRTEDGAKQPNLIHLPGEAPMFEPFAFAGITSYNKTLDIRSFAR